MLHLSKKQSALDKYISTRAQISRSQPPGVSKIRAGSAAPAAPASQPHTSISRWSPPMIRHPLHSTVGRAGARTTAADLSRVADGLAATVRSFSAAQQRRAADDDRSGSGRGKNDGPPSPRRERLTNALDDIMSLNRDYRGSQGSTLAPARGGRGGPSAVKPNPINIVLGRSAGGPNPSVRRIGGGGPGGRGGLDGGPNIIRGGFRGRGGRGGDFRGGFSRGGRGGRGAPRGGRGGRGGISGRRDRGSRRGGVDDAELEDFSGEGRDELGIPPEARAEMAKADDEDVPPELLKQFHEFKKEFQQKAAEKFHPEIRRAIEGEIMPYDEEEAEYEQTREEVEGKEMPYGPGLRLADLVGHGPPTPTSPGALVIRQTQMLPMRKEPYPAATKQAVLEGALLGKHVPPQFAETGDTLGVIRSYVKREGSYYSDAEKRIEAKVASLLPGGGGSPVPAKFN
ncbi:hypothetical protein GGR56DRAFT_648626 [Xylariaceae sp. FL0804]|nr:hypothetical protein GGR56DRAFT_648626 [Xylariaceae sp. FL0804]